MIITTYFKDLSNVFFAPSDFFQTKQLSPKRAIQHLLATSLLAFPIHVAWFLITFDYLYKVQYPSLFDFTPNMGQFLLDTFPFSTKLYFALISFLLLLTGFIAFAHVIIVLSHFALYVVKGSKGFGKTYQAILFSLTPVLLFLPIFGINMMTWLWSLYPQISGLKILHDTSLTKAIISVAFPIIVIIMSGVVIFAVF